jgi:hypothetical protein
MKMSGFRELMAFNPRSGEAHGTGIEDLNISINAKL